MGKRTKLKKKLRPKIPRCGNCRHPGFWLIKEEDNYTISKRPLFQCDNCKTTWTAGKDGKPYIDHTMGTNSLQER
jgi:hypothetical protein